MAVDRTRCVFVLVSLLVSMWMGSFGAATLPTQEKNLLTRFERQPTVTRKTLSHHPHHRGWHRAAL